MKIKVTSIFVQYDVDGVNHTVSISDGRISVGSSDPAKQYTTTQELSLINGLVDTQYRAENS